MPSLVDDPLSAAATPPGDIDLLVRYVSDALAQKAERRLIESAGV